MPLVRLGQKLVFFAHIPKTGGSSLEDWLSAAGRVALRHNSAIEGMHCPPQHMHAALFEPLFKNGFLDASFAVLRDPTARLVSEYRYRRGQVERRGKREMPSFERWAERAFRLYEDNPYFLDNHIRPQAEFVGDGMKLFRLEDGLEAVTDWLQELSGVEGPELTHKLQSTGEAVGVSVAMQVTIRKFYAADFELLDSLT
ncbi:sulfotransferase family protein [Lentibacter algarum]|nr:sulfotransferase family 2 domain-containing protein [Lentibacter algarum]MBU2983550.1 sulfotransferase family protein [Lentibacter algarum]